MENINTVADFVQSIRPLKYEQRKAVRDKAIADLIKAPNIKDYTVNTAEFQHVKKRDYLSIFLYGTIITLMSILFILSASVSALRISAGVSQITEDANPTFAESEVPFTDWKVSDFSGWALFPAVESALIVFPLIGSVLGDKKKWFDSVTIWTTLGITLGVGFSLVMNYYVESPNLHSQTVAKALAAYGAWLLAPGFSTIFAMLLKKLITSAIDDSLTKQQDEETRRKNREAEYKLKLAAYEAQVDDPSLHPRWYIVYAGMLRDAMWKIYPVMYDHDMLELLTNEDWRSLIKREIDQDTIAIDFQQKTRLEKKLALQETVGVIQKDDDPLWYATSSLDGWVSEIGYKHKGKALSIARKHEQEQEREAA